MSILSPTAAAILNSIQSSGKSDAKSADANAFLTLLESGAPAAQAPDIEPSALDTLYTAKAPVAAPQQAKDEAFVDAKREPQEARTAAPKANANNNSNGNQKKDAPATADRKAEDAPKKEMLKATEKKSAPQEARQVMQPAKPVKSEKTADNEDTEIASADDVDVDVDAVAAAIAEGGITLENVIHAKLQTLSDLLSTIAAIAGATGVSQVTVQVTQTTTITATEVSGTLQGNTPFADLSDRFQQLIAAISTSQNLPGETKEALIKTFGDFQSMVNALTQAPADATIDPTIDPTAALTVKTAALQTDISKAIEKLQVAPETADAPQVIKALTQPLTQSLEQLSKWAGDVQKLVTAAAPKIVSEVAAANTNVQKMATPELAALPDDVQAVVATMVQKPLPQIKAQPQTEKKSSDIATAAIAAVKDSPVATIAAATSAAPVQATAAATPSAPAAAIAAAVVETTGANLSNNAGGQGGDRPQTPAASAPVGLAAANATPTTNAPNFTNALKAAQTATPQMPVAEQVAFNIKTAVKGGSRQLEVQLDPAELGKVRIKMDISSDGKASNIVITADNKQTLDLLQRDQRNLQQALSDAGLKTDSGSLSFNLRGGEGGRQQEDQRQAHASYAPKLKEEDELAPLAVVTRSYVVNATDGLDIQI